MSEKSARPRNPRIEALRLVAILGIAVFHTFQPWFDAATSGAWAPSAATLSVLGCVNLLGSYGNFVFFLISGLFLVPRAVEDARTNIPWRRRWLQVLRRALPILATVAIYAACALLVSSFVTPIEGVSLGETGWLAGGLQFIWVYLALVVASPVMGQVWAHARKPRHLVGALVVAVFVVNAYIAFVSPGENVRGLLEWRKLMSAVSYLAAFLAGGALAGSEHPRLARALGLASDDPSQRAVSAFTGMLLHFLMNVPNELYRGREREWAEYFVRILREMIERLPVTEPKPF